MARSEWFNKYRRQWIFSLWPPFFPFIPALAFLSPASTLHPYATATPHICQSATPGRASAHEEYSKTNRCVTSVIKTNSQWCSSWGAWGCGDNFCSWDNSGERRRFHTLCQPEDGTTSTEHYVDPQPIVFPFKPTWTTVAWSRSQKSVHDYGMWHFLWFNLQQKKKNGMDSR